MKHLKIKTDRFLQWYFEDGEGTTEHTEILEGIAEKIVERLKNGNVATITTKEIFDDICNQDAIRLSYCEGYYEVEEDLEKYYDVELGDLKEKYTLTLIN